MDRLPHELLVLIWSEAYNDIERDTSPKRAKGRQWLLQTLFESRWTLGVGRQLLYSFLYLDSVPIVLAVTKALQQKNHLADLCLSLVLCPPILDVDSVHHIKLRFELYDSPDDKLYARDTRPSDAGAPESLHQEDVDKLFQLLPNLLHLQTAGIQWEMMYTALQRAPFRESLKQFYLRHFRIPASITPVLMLHPSLLPSLQSLDVCEMNRSALPIEQEDVSSVIPMQTKASGEVDRQVADSWRCSLRSYSMVRDIFDDSINQDESRYDRWSPQQVAQELSFLTSQLRTLNLALPASYCQLVPDHMAHVLPCLRELELQIEVNPSLIGEVHMWSPGLDNLLKACIRLRCFTLRCDEIPAQVLDAISESMERLSFDGTTFEAADSRAMPLLELPALVQKLESKTSLPHLVALSYTPYTYDTLQFLSSAINSRDFSERDWARGLVEDIDILQKCCDERDIVLSDKGNLLEVKEKAEELEGILDTYGRILMGVGFADE